MKYSCSNSFAALILLHYLIIKKKYFNYSSWLLSNGLLSNRLFASTVKLWKPKGFTVNISFLSSSRQKRREKQPSACHLSCGAAASVYLRPVTCCFRMWPHGCFLSIQLSPLSLFLATVYSTAEKEKEHKPLPHPRAWVCLCVVRQQVLAAKTLRRAPRLDCLLQPLSCHNAWVRRSINNSIVAREVHDWRPISRRQSRERKISFMTCREKTEATGG